MYGSSFISLFWISKAKASAMYKEQQESWNPIFLSYCFSLSYFRAIQNSLEWRDYVEGIIYKMAHHDQAKLNSPAWSFWDLLSR